MARRTFWPWKSSRPPRTTSRSLSWTGTPRLPTRTWDCGGRSTWRTSGPVALRYPSVVSHVDAPQNAQLTVTALLKNSSKEPVKGTLKGTIDKVEFSQDVELAAGESKDVTFEPEKFSQLSLTGPRLWWPAQMGSPNSTRSRWSSWSMASNPITPIPNSAFAKSLPNCNAQQRRVFSINGKKILIRGGGWSPDMMLREELAAPGRRVPLRSRHGSEHHPPRRQTGNRRVLRAALIARRAGDGGLVLLRPLGAAGPNGSRRISTSPRPRCRTRFIACAAIPAW